MTAAGPAIIEPPVAARPAPATRPSRAGQSGYLPTLDGWRAIAILQVMSAHAQRSARLAWGNWATPLRWLDSLGGTGVRIFFAISGFLICTRLLSEYNAHGHLRLKVFYIRRVHRIL